MTGAIVADAVLMGSLGLRGTGLFAAGLNVLAAAGGLFLSRGPTPVAPAEPPRGPLSWNGRRLLAAAFVCGGTLLALEVVWFRVLMLFVDNSSHALALLLGVILLGIALGGLVASTLTRRVTEPQRWVPLVALTAGVVCATSYAALGPLMTSLSRGLAGDTLTIVKLSVPLMFPTSFLSGMLFTLLGAAAQRELGSSTRSAGLFTMANTVGSMAGALVGGFLLLPVLGIELSFFLLALAYGLVAALVAPGTFAAATSWGRRVTAGALLLFALRFAAFPLGLMTEVILPIPLKPYLLDGSRLVATREGLTETLSYLEKDWLGRPVEYRMLTNGFSMSGTAAPGQRYMKLFAHWAAAFHPAPKKALLISYGVGCTAKALTEMSGLERIDVVDLSADVLEMAEVVYPARADQPLADPRVKAHVEDGRYFLLATQDRYDLITAEPPPPKNAGIVNLYTAEYFKLLREHLSDGGIATYWLPVHSLTREDAAAISLGFCAAFPDCTLWNGSGLDWMLVGSAGMRVPTEEQLARPWADATLGPSLRAIGVEGPEQLGALFLMDAAQLAEWSQGLAPLVDDRPRRLSPAQPPEVMTAAFEQHVALMNADAARARFEKSAWVRTFWPETLRARTLEAFRTTGWMNERLLPAAFARIYWIDFAALHQALTSTAYQTLPLWMLRSTEVEQAIARGGQAEGARDPMLAFHLLVGAMARRDWAATGQLVDGQKVGRSTFPEVTHLYAYAMCLSGRTTQAVALGRWWRTQSRGDDAFWVFLEKTFNLASTVPGSP